MALDASKIHPLGFGCMRFNGREKNEIDLELTQKMIDTFIAAGGNYFDTAWAYPNSERALGQTLAKTYPRDAYMVATKCVAWTHCESRADLEQQLQDSLADLGLSYVDVYLMHNLGGPRAQAYEQYSAWEFMKEAKARGLAKHIGFSAHCTPEELERFLAQYPEAEVVQLQINYQDWENPSFRERECLEIAHRHGLPVIAMEPVKGGYLANPPAAVKEIIRAEFPTDSYATAALRFAASAPGVAVTLSGMNSLEQVEENCRAFANFRPFDARELAMFERIQEALKNEKTVPCTACNYCAKVCPQGVDISGALAALNYYINYGDAKMANTQMGILAFVEHNRKLMTECISCGACEAACPQNIAILEHFETIKAEILPAHIDMVPLIRE